MIYLVGVGQNIPESEQLRNPGAGYSKHFKAVISIMRRQYPAPAENLTVLMRRMFQCGR